MRYNPAKKRYLQSRRAIWTRWIVVGLLLVTAALDFISFAIEKKFQAFDMSLLTIWFSNIWIIFLIKFAVIGALIYLLIGVKKAGDYSRYLWLMMAVYLILFQFVGFISNMQVAEQDPSIESAPSVEVRTTTGINFALIWGYFPIGFAMLSFWLWNLGWRDE